MKNQDQILLEKLYVAIYENTSKTIDELGKMSNIDYANYLDSSLSGIKHKSDRYYEILEPLMLDPNDRYKKFINYDGYIYWEARNLISKMVPNSLKFKKVNDNNSNQLHNEYDYVANVNGIPFGLNKWEDPDYDPYGDIDDDSEEEEGEENGKKKTKGNLKFVWAYKNLESESASDVETLYNIGYGDEELMQQMLNSLDDFI